MLTDWDDEGSLFPQREAGFLFTADSGWKRGVIGEDGVTREAREPQAMGLELLPQEWMLAEEGQEAGLLEITPAADSVNKLKEFQTAYNKGQLEKNRVSVKGVADEETMEALWSRYEKLLKTEGFIKPD